MSLRRLLKSATRVAGVLLILITAGAFDRLPAFAFPDDPPSIEDLCTVSVLNRTSTIQPDGSFSIPNVPAASGVFRVRLNCPPIEFPASGRGIATGQTGFFTPVANSVTSVGRLQLGVADPIPTSITVAALTTTLSNVGSTTQLTVTGTFPDATTKDLTAQSTGTSYTTSNAAIATVSLNGLVTAGSTSGTVVVSAMNEGALGLIRVQVVLAGDSDGDGILDDVELANGLNPNNPVDALEDFDGDGLTNKQELIDFGTNFQVADTDGDGLLDGEKVVAGVDGFITNPLLADTDGDGLRDGLEITTGSDPTDPASFNLAQALASLEVTPSVLPSLAGRGERSQPVFGKWVFCLTAGFSQW